MKVLRQKTKRDHVNRLLTIKEYLINNIHEDFLKDKLEKRIELDLDNLWLTVNIDEFYFIIDGYDFEVFCKENFKGHFNSDKQFIIEDLDVHYI